MVKVSITLPNSAQITLEAAEDEIIHGVVGIVLRDLPRDLMHHVQSLDGVALPSPESEKGISVTGSVVTESPDAAHHKTGDARGTSKNSDSASQSSTGAAGRQRAARQSPPTQDSGDLAVTTRGPSSPEQESNFAGFCRSANPLGDMRRVVVAAEGASRILGMASRILGVAYAQR